MVNKESLPLIFGLMIPVILVLFILLRIYGYDVTLFFEKIPLLYYIILFPICLGFIVGIAKFMRPN